MKNTTEKMMEDMKFPTVATHKYQQLFYSTLMRTKKSAAIGILLLMLPLLFLSGVILKHYLQIDFGVFTSVYEWIGKLDYKYGDASVWNWIIRFLLLFGPFLALAINLLAITHIHYQKTNRILVMVFKIKWLNILLIIVCATLLSVFVGYLLVENV